MTTNKLLAQAFLAISDGYANAAAVMANSPEEFTAENVEKVLTTIAEGDEPLKLDATTAILDTELSHGHIEDVRLEPDPLHLTDSANVEWDERIHAGTKTTKADGTWKRRKGVTDELVKQVLAEKAPVETAEPEVSTEDSTTPPPPPSLMVDDATPPPPPSMDAEPAAVEETPERTRAITANAYLVNTLKLSFDDVKDVIEDKFGHRGFDKLLPSQHGACADLLEHIQSGYQLSIKQVNDMSQWASKGNCVSHLESGLKPLFEKYGADYPNGLVKPMDLDEYMTHIQARHDAWAKWAEENKVSL